MSDIIIIPVDLDQKQLEKSYSQVEEKSVSSGEKSAENFAVSFSKQLTKSLNKLQIGKRLSESLFIGSTTIASLAFLEKEFRVLSTLSNKLGVDFVNLVNRLERVKDSLIGLSTGTSSLRKVRIETGLLLRDLGLIDSKFLGFIAVVQKAQGLFNSFTAVLITVGPILLELEKRFKVFSKLAERIGISFEDVSEKSDGLIKTFQGFIAGEKSFLSLKLAAGSLLQELGLVDSKLLQTITLIQRGGSVSTEILDVAGATAVVGATLVPVVRNLKDFRELLSDVGNIALRPKGIFGVVSATGTVAAGLAILGEALDGVESKFLSALRASFLLTASLLGGFSAAIGFAIVKVADLAIEVGTNLVNAFKASTEQFISLRSEVKVLNATIDAFNKVTGEAVGASSSYEVLIGGLSKRLNLLEKDLVKAAREIVQVGSQLGLQEKQLKQLIVVASEYAKINGKDVFDVSVALAGALNGQSQAVTNLGIKLDEASVQAFAFKQGLSENFRNLASGSKVQLRYEKLIDQFNKVSGIADARAQSLGDSQNRLNVQIEAINKSFGEGASLIERNNLATFAASKILAAFNEEALFLAGTGGAIISRLIQIGGAITKVSFALFGLRKGIELTNRALQSQVGINAFASSLPLIGKSLNQILSQAGRTQVVVRDLSSLLTGLSSAISVTLLGSTGKGVSAFGALRAVIRTLLVNLRTFIPVIVTLGAPFVVIGAKIALLVGALLILKNAFVAIQERTVAFTKVYEIFLGVLNETSSILEPIADSFSKFASFVGEILQKVFGRIVFGISKIFSLAISIARKNPFGVFSKNTISSLESLQVRLDGFSEKIRVAGFDLNKIPKIARNVAGQVKNVKFEVDLEKLSELRREFSNFGTSEITILQTQLNKRLELVRNAVQQEIITRSEGARITAGLQAQFAQQSDQVLSEQAFSFQNSAEQINAGLRSIARQSQITGKTVASALVNGIGRGAGNAFSAFGQAIVQGENALEAFGKALLSAFGSSLVQLGTGFILQGIAQSLAGFGSGAPLIAAGAALATFGGVLSGIAGGGAPQTSAGATGAIGSDGGFGTSPELPPLSDEQANEPETKVQVVIQGDVFDSQETGLRIAQVLQEASLNNNVKILGGIA